MKLRLLLIATVVASLFLAAPFVATALGPTYKSVVNIRASKPVFHGRVHLRNAGEHPGVARPCRTHRRVTLLRRTPSSSGSKGDVKRMGRTRTNRRGRWVIHPT